MAADQAAERPPVFRVRALNRSFVRSGSAGRRVVQAVADLDLDILAGQRVGIVGESGSGKSTLVRMLAALMRPSSGSIEYLGREIVGRREAELSDLRAGVQMVFQDPRSSLDPRMKVGRIITEALRSPLLARHPDVPRSSPARITELLLQVGLEPEAADHYPHEFSGGQRQRIAIARALAPSPQVLIADEAVSALDVSVRGHVLNLIVDLVKQRGLTLLFVSHDLAVVSHVCDQVVVMRQGRIVESGSITEVYQHPEDPYTRELLAAIPHIRPRGGEAEFGAD